MMDRDMRSCKYCLVPISPSDLYCEDCLPTRKAILAQLEQDGICLTCEELPIAVGKKRCAPCHEAMSKKRAEKRANRSRSNCCVACDMPALPGGSRCYNCFFKTCASGSSSRTGVKVSAEELRKLYEANPRCAYTGTPLTLTSRGDPRRATLDHRIPVSKGGSNGLDNLQWVCEDINYLKHDKDHAAFIQLYGHLFDRFFEGVSR